ncbi:MAG: hypothetical protein WEB30_01415 [Cyclobacteriaceae bacterium]
MKPFNRPPALFACFCIFLSLSACDHDLSIGSSVHEDGSIERTIVLYDADSSLALHNIFNVNEAGGWETTIQPSVSNKIEGAPKSTQNITFKKHFASAADANLEMTGGADSLFHIRSGFEKKPGWFYTYTEYSDTYLALNRFHALPLEDYFTTEDFTFIDRLPPEGKAITKADSLYLAMLNEKIYEVYGGRTIFEELFKHTLSTMRKYNIESRWEDSLMRRKEVIYKKFLEDGNDENEHLWTTANLLHIPLPPSAQEDFRKKSKEVESRIELISEASSGKFKHMIHMPGRVVETNADSVNHNLLLWNPPVIKFLLTDYTMTARSRKMNVWPVVISLLVVAGTLILFFLRRRAV